PLPKEKLHQLRLLVQEQLAVGHIVPSTSPWNSPVFVIKKKSGKWQLLHYLRQINEVMEDKGPLQPSLPSPTMIPQNWKIDITDLKDWFFTIPLHPKDAPCFAFSVPSLNMSEPYQRYHWVVLPQSMKNSPTICQWYVARALSPVQQQFPSVLIYHYMDDILLSAAMETELELATNATFRSINRHGLTVTPEKIQQTSPWKYLGWKIVHQTAHPQSMWLGVDIETLNDLQKVLGAVNWIRPLLGINNEDLHPLFELLKGNPAL
ncbi:hypothetical protein N341_05551, partial [Tyto alba]